MNKQSKNRIIFSVLVFILSLNLKAQTASTSQPNAGNPQFSGEIQVYNYPRICPKNNDFKLKANGRDIFVYNTSAEPFAAFSASGMVHIEVETTNANPNIAISPKKLGIVPRFDGNKISFDLPSGTNVVLAIESKPILFIYANKMAENIPSPTAQGVYYFKAGQVYEVGELRLKDNETLYIEGGAVVRGCVKATSAKNVRIAGQGILDGGYYKNSGESRRSIILEDCRNSVIQDIIMIEPTSWMIMLGICDQVTVSNVKEIGEVASSDGCDIVGSKRIRVENCFFRNGDDCIAIKSLDLRPFGKSATLDYAADVEEIEITGSSFMAFLGGQALEIGHEIRTNKVSNVRFRDCDILGVHRYGAAFGIHNADRALITDILYENIRVEHHYNKLLEFRVIESRWGKDTERGQIRNVTFRNIDVFISVYNPGYSLSIIGGLDSKHTVENVSFENFRMNGKPVTNADEMDLYCKQAKNVTFK